MLVVKEIEGSYDGSGMTVGIVLAEFNDFITENLLDGALEGLRKCQVNDEDITVYRVPGSFEIPGMGKRVLEKGDLDGLICLGAVIRGETPHFDYICSHVTSGVGELNMNYDIPVIFGVLTTDTVEQATNRAGVKVGNMGKEAAMSLIQTIRVYRAV